VWEKPKSAEASDEHPSLRESFRRAVVKARQVLREKGLSDPEIDAEMNLAEPKEEN
jgi:hypothetical protein